MYCPEQQSQTHDNNIQQQHSDTTTSTNQLPPIPRPPQYVPRQIGQTKSVSEQAVSRPSGGNVLLTARQHDKLKGWLHTVRKKTARLSTKITASLGLISLTRDEEFEKHYENFKHLEKTIRAFIKNITLFVEHFESFLLALQHTSENLSDLYRDKKHQKELLELRRKNKTLACEHFHSFKRTVDRQVIAVASQLLQKFSGPKQLASKRSAKLLDFDTKSKELESCRDLQKKATIRDQYVVAKELYDRVNGQLVEELPLFNQFALDIFRECILVLLESRRVLIQAFTNQTASLLQTPLMASYTASDVASTIMLSCEDQAKPGTINTNGINHGQGGPKMNDMRMMLDQKQQQQHLHHQHLHQGSGGSSSRQTSEHLGTHQSCSSAASGTSQFDHPTRSHSVASQLSSEFDRMAIAAREISSTPLSQVDPEEPGHLGEDEVANTSEIPRPEGDRNHHYDHDQDDGRDDSVRFVVVDEPDGVESHQINGADVDNKQNESIEAAATADLEPPPPPPAQVESDEPTSGDNELRSAATSLGGKKSGGDKDRSVSSRRSNGGGGGGGRNRRRKYPIYIASWPFAATGPNQLTISSNQPLKLIKDCDECGNSDWSLVKDRKGQMGYVPSSYIKLKDVQQ